jgi:methyl-accepting chemotaxis protein
MSIKFKLYSGFGLLVLLALGLALYGVHVFGDVGESVTRLDGIAGNTTRTLLVEDYLERLRRSVLRYAYDHDEPSRQENEEVAAKALSTLKEAQQATPSEERKKMYADVLTELAVVQQKSQLLFETVRKVAAAQANLAKYGDTLSGTTHALIDKLHGSSDQSLELLAAKLESQLLSVRLANFRAQLTLDAKALAAIDDAASVATATLDTLEKTGPQETRAQTEALKAALVAYVAESKPYLNNIKQTGVLFRDQIQPPIKQMQATIQTLRQQLQQNFDETKSSVETSIVSIVLSQKIIGGGALLLGALIAFFVARSIFGPIRNLVDVLAQIEKGNTNIEIKGTERTDEIGSLAKAVVVIRASRDSQVANSRIKTGLDVVRSNVMIADDQYNIIYLNSSLNQMLREAEPELRGSLTNFDCNKLIGTNIDVFHKNPAHQRALLAKLTGSYEARITVGTLKFALVATAIMDGEGKRVGTVVEWRNETMEKAIEGEIDAVVKAAIAGDFSKRLTLEGKKEFMLNLATAMNDLCENISRAIEDVARVLSALAKGNLTQRITADYQGAFAKLKSDANATAEQLGSTIGDIKSAAREVNNASAEISASTTDLSQRTEEQAASLEQTSASMEEISATVKKNAENARRANELTSGSRDTADRGGAVVADAVKAMARIEESSRKIADIIGVIDEIARQTNLLALNAAVEAARAGDAGRGFAVVASEVRTLAQRSSQAAKDIKDLITSSSGQVQDGVGLVNQAGTSLSEIVESIKQVADIVADIATASSEQAEGLEQINKAITQMDEVTQQNSALVEQNAASAKALEQQSTTMDERVAFFQLDGGAQTVAGRQPVKAASRAAAGGRGTAGAQVAEASPPQAAAVPAKEQTKAQPKDQPKAPGKERPKPKVVAETDAKPTVKAKDEGWKGPVGRMQAMVATAFQQEPDWKEF